MFDLMPMRRKGQRNVPEAITEMNDLINRMWYGFPFHNIGEDRDINWSPRLDVSETEKAVHITADLPGLEKKDISISLEDDLLTISGERKEEKEEKGKTYHTLERRSGSFFRSIRLPAEVDKKKVDAAFSNGVLTITLPKSTETRRSKTVIEIK